MSVHLLLYILRKKIITMNYLKNSFLILLGLAIFTGCSKKDKIACDTNSIIYYDDKANCATAKTTFYKKNGPKEESVGISFNGNGPFIITTTQKPFEVKTYQKYNADAGEGCYFTRLNQTYLKSVSV